jgi:hypothetical protein
MFLMLDDDLGAMLEQQFAEDITYADEIDLATFRKRPMLDRVKERGAHVIRRVL